MDTLLLREPPISLYRHFIYSILKILFFGCSLTVIFIILIVAWLYLNINRVDYFNRWEYLHEGTRKIKWKLMVKIGPYDKKSFLIQSVPAVTSNLLQRIKAYLRLNEDTFVQFIKDKGEILNVGSKLYDGDSVFALPENTFGSLDAVQHNAREQIIPVIQDGKSETFNKNSISIVFANVSGGLNNRFSAEKRHTIKSSTFGDAVLMFNECNCVMSDTSFLSNTFGVDAKVSDLAFVNYEKGQRKNLTRRKISGFGTAMISKVANLIDFLDPSTIMKSFDFEIVVGRINLNKKVGLLISAYRSPSMANEIEINAFYEAIHDIFKKFYTENTDFCIVCMDDNKTSTSAQNAQNQWLKEKCGMINLIGDQITRIRSSTQPDSILCVFKPLSCTIRATVIAPLGIRMDHNAVRIRITGCSIKPRKPQYREIKRRAKHISDEEIREILTKNSESFIRKYSQEVENDDVSDEIVDNVTRDMYAIINKTKNVAWDTVTVRLPDCLDDNADKWTVKIGIEHARMEKLGLHLQTNPKDKRAYEKFVDAQRRCLKFMAEKRDADCDLDLKHNKSSYYGPFMGNFYKWCDKYVSNKGSYLSKTHSLLTDEEKMEKLKAHDKTFMSNDPNFKCEMESMLGIQADRTFCLDSWKPSKHNSKLADFIKSRSKVDVFFKINADIIAPSLFILLKLIEKTCYFPQKMRTSKATFIPGRTIFSLETLVKIVEGVLCVELVRCDELDFDLNGDPGSFAYRKCRGVLSCLGIALGELEKSPREEMIDAVMNVIDLKKAFNTTKRSTVVKVAQRVAGAGKLIMTRWVNRTYTFEKQVRGHKYNRGTDAGATLAVWGFDKWINTDVSCQTRGPKNSRGIPIILANCNFSDDRSPNTRGSDVESGQYQTEVLDQMDKWAQEEDAEFHTQGSKAPGTLLFSQIVNGEQTKRPKGVENLSLSGKTIEITQKQKILGVTVATEVHLFRDGHTSSVFKNPKSQEILRKQAQKLINKHGFYLDPDLNYLVNSAYRFHQLRNEINPLKMWTVVNSYFLGKMRFAISFHYLRCTEIQLNFMRFHYGMSMAAILDISAYEALGAGCCKNRAIKEGNEAFERLRKSLNLPSIREMAICDAKVCISQMADAKQDWFFPKSTRARQTMVDEMKKSHAKGKHYYPKSLCADMRDTFIGDLYKLAGESVASSDISDVSLDDIVNFKRNWFMSLEAASNIKNTPDKIHTSIVKTAQKVFKIKSLVDIGAFESNDRRTRRRTPSKPLIPSRLCKVYPPDVEGKDYLYLEDTKSYEFSCNHEIPTLWLEKDLKVNNKLCVACGDLIPPSEIKNRPSNCVSCHRFIHKKCIRKHKLSADNFECDQISKRFVPVKLGSQKLREFKAITPKVATGQMRCLICGELCLNDCGTKTRCNKPGCSFGCHTSCLDALQKIYKILGMESIDKESWSCDDITFWIDNPTVQKLNTLKTISKQLISTLIDTYNIEKVVIHKDARKRRYDNNPDEQRCPYCGLIVPLEEKDHLWSRCTAFQSSPVSKDPMESLSRIKRRCLEYVKLSHKNAAPEIIPSKDSEINKSEDELANNTTEENTPPPVYSERHETDVFDQAINNRSSSRSRDKTGTRTYAEVARTPEKSKYVEKNLVSPRNSHLQSTSASTTKELEKLICVPNTPVATRTRSKRKKNSTISIEAPKKKISQHKIHEPVRLRNRFELLDVSEFQKEKSATDASQAINVCTHKIQNQKSLKLRKNRPIQSLSVGNTAKIIQDANSSSSVPPGYMQQRPRRSQRLKKNQPVQSPSVGNTAEIIQDASSSSSVPPGHRQQRLRRSQRLARQTSKFGHQESQKRHYEGSSRDCDRIPKRRSESNNVETLQKTRGNNVRLQIESVESPSHSEGPGPPGCSWSAQPH